jgi:FkbM family methyltransferase
MCSASRWWVKSILRTPWVLHAPEYYAQRNWSVSELRPGTPLTFESLLMLYARRFPIRRGKLRVINWLWRAVVGDHGRHRVTVLNHGGFKMTCDLNEMLQRQFYFFGTYFLEKNILRCWETAAKGTKVVFDVGANAGIYSLAALAIQPDATVHAFEPTPEIAARLRATAKLNGLDHLYVHEAAVFRKNGQAILKRFRGEQGTNEGMNFIVSNVGDSDAERVQTVCLDQFCQDHTIEHVDLLKLDIQGHEHSALEGAERLIRAGHVGFIFTELNWANSSGVTCAATESIRLLEQAGYRFSRPGKRLHWEEAGDWLRTLTDVVAHRARP